MRKLIVALTLAFALPAAAQQVVNQGNGSNSVVPWKTRVVTSTGTAVDVFGVRYFATTGAPAATLAVSTVSAAATGLTAGAIYRVTCDTTVRFRLGTGTPVALTTDSAFFGPATEYIGFPSTATAFAAITLAGTGTCTLLTLTLAP